VARASKCWIARYADARTDELKSEADMDTVWQTKTHLRVMMVIAVVIAVMPTVASAQDGFDPPAVVGTAAPGESLEPVNKTLHLDARPGFADIILAVDTTLSMQPAIDQARQEAATMCTQIKAQIPGARFAVVDFKDYPAAPYGETGDFPYLLKTPGFVPDCGTVQAAVLSLIESGGGDQPEAYNRVFFESYHSDPLMPSPLVYNPMALKFLVVLGDAPPHDPTQGGTMAQPGIVPACGDQPPVDPGPDNIPGTGDDLRTADTLAGLRANDINLLMVWYNTGGVQFQCFVDLVVAAGGADTDVVFGNATATTSNGALSQEIVAAVLDKASRIGPINLVVNPGCPLTINFNPGPTFGARTAPTDIRFTETITVPTNATGGPKECTVTAVVDGVNRAMQSVTVDVVAAPMAPCRVDIDDFDHDGIRDDYDVDDDNDGRWDSTDDDDDNDGRRDNDDDDDDNDCIKDEHDRKDRHEYEDECDGRTEGRYGKQYRDYSIVAKPGNLVVIGVVESPNANLLWIDLYDPSGRFVARSTASPGRAMVTATTVVPGVYTMRVRNRSASPITYQITLIKGVPW
jgi:hypothetical protein